MNNFLYKALLVIAGFILLWFIVYKYKQDKPMVQKEEKQEVVQKKEEQEVQKQITERKAALDKKTLQQGMITAMLAGALGDAMGRVTEFIPSTEKIFQNYPNGIRNFDDFLARDWAVVPEKLQNKHIAPYTDDTRMAKLVLNVLLDAQKNKWDRNRTMVELARVFVDDMHDMTYGWAASFRAPGNATRQSVKKLENLMQGVEEISELKTDWWQVGHPDAGGSGTVMRAHPFGLVFFNNPAKAEKWAVEHAKLTHGHPMALAAPAAMAVGIAYALQGKDPVFIIDQMIMTAQKYDMTTAEKMRQAYALAQEAKPKFAQFRRVRGGYEALANLDFRKFHDYVFTKFQGWAADDAIAATVYIFALTPDDVRQAIYLGVHTPGDSDSIASMVGALVGAYTKEELPAELIEKLEDADELRASAEEIITY